MRSVLRFFVSAGLIVIAAYGQLVPRLAIGSAASGATTIAPGSIASAYGLDLTNQTQSAGSLPLPTTLAGITLQVTDGLGEVNTAGLIFASPAQINFVVPAATAAGTATVRVMSGSSVVSVGQAQVQPTAPGLFAMNQAGVAAALALRTIAPSGPQTVFPTFECSQGTCSNVPLNLGVDTPLYLELFGTGISGSSNVTVTINGQAALVLFAGPQAQFPGLDQVNVPLDLSLRGAGVVPVVVMVDGQRSNTVFIDVQ